MHGLFQKTLLLAALGMTTAAPLAMPQGGGVPNFAGSGGNGAAGAASGSGLGTSQVGGGQGTAGGIGEPLDRASEMASSGANNVPGANQVMNAASTVQNMAKAPMNMLSGVGGGSGGSAAGSAGGVSGSPLQGK